MEELPYISTWYSSGGAAPCRESRPTHQRRQGGFPGLAFPVMRRIRPVERSRGASDRLTWILHKLITKEHQSTRDGRRKPGQVFHLKGNEDSEAMNPPMAIRLNDLGNNICKAEDVAKAIRKSLRTQMETKKKLIKRHIWYSAIGQTAGENESLVFHSENEYTLAVS